MSYNTVMTACGEGGSWELALKLFREMAPPGGPAAPPVAGAAGVARRRGPVAPDLMAYNTIIDVCKKRGRWQEAVDILREMSRPPGVVSPNVVTYTSAFVACGRSGRWDQALEASKQRTWALCLGGLYGGRKGLPDDLSPTQ